MKSSCTKETKRKASRSYFGPVSFMHFYFHVLMFVLSGLNVKVYQPAVTRLDSPCPLNGRPTPSWHLLDESSTDCELIKSHRGIRAPAHLSLYSETQLNNLGLARLQQSCQSQLHASDCPVVTIQVCQLFGIPTNLL